VNINEHRLVEVNLLTAYFFRIVITQQSTWSAN